MKLILAIIEAEDAPNLLKELTTSGFRATRIRTHGGFLHDTNATLLLGVDDPRVDEVVALIREQCTTRQQYVSPLPPVMEPGEFYVPSPLEVELGGATIFVLDVERAERL